MLIKNMKMVTEDENIEEKIDLHDRLKNGYKNKNGIKVYATFNQNGKDITECWREYIKNKLKG